MLSGVTQTQILQLPWELSAAIFLAAIPRVQPRASHGFTGKEQLRVGALRSMSVDGIMRIIPSPGTLTHCCAAGKGMELVYLYLYIYVYL